MTETPERKRAYRYKKKPKAPPLSEADRVFCVQMVTTNSLAKAVVAAMPHIEGNAAEVARWSRNFMARNPIKKELERLKAQVSAQSSFEVADALEGFLAIVRSNPNDLVSVRVGNCRHCNGAGFRYQWTEREYVEAVREVEKNRATWRKRGASADVSPETQFPDPDVSGGFGFQTFPPPHPDCPECGGEGIPRVVASDTRTEHVQGHPLYAGVKMTKHGPEIVMHDKTRALENAVRIIGGFEDKVRLRAEVNTTSFAIETETTDPNVAADIYKQVMASGG